MPSHADLRLMRAMSAAEYAAAGLMLGVAQLQPDVDPSDHGPLLLLAAVNVLIGALVMRLPARVGILRAFNLLAIVLVSAVMALAKPVGPTPFFYLWPMLTMAYFLPRRDVAVGFGLLAGSFGAVLALWSGEPNPEILFGGVIFTILFVTVIVVRLKEHLRALIGELHQSATTDALTGLVNRRAFTAAFERELERARTAGLRLTLVSFDLDHFKQINDRFGHAAGDEALRRFAGVLAGECSPGDVPARVGGEEFAAVLFDRTAEDGRGFAERVAARLAEDAGDGPRLTVSAGIAELSAEEDTPGRVLLAADRALYGAKAAGRDRVQVWAPVAQAA
jgi:diguanylate cyclase (GGDEF)-like protein